MKMKVKRIHTCHSHCRVNCRKQPLLLNQLLNASVFLPRTAIVFNDSSIVVRVHWRRLGLGAPLDGAETVATLEPAKPKRTYHQPSGELRNWVVDYALLRPTRTLRQWLEENKKEGREPRDAYDVLILILREKCDPGWRDRRPDVRVCDAAHLRQRRMKFKLTRERQSNGNPNTCRSSCLVVQSAPALLSRRSCTSERRDHWYSEVEG